MPPAFAALFSSFETGEIRGPIVNRKIPGAAITATLLVTAIAVAAADIFRAPLKLRAVSSSLWAESFEQVLRMKHCGSPAAGNPD